MMPKFFVASDIHGFYEEFREALSEAGFDRNNSEHWLVTLGDHFDRGRQPLEVMKYLMGLERCICVRGNHEQLLLDLMNRKYAYTHDWHNGTSQTVVDLAPNAQGFDVACSTAYYIVRDFIDSMVDYFETKNHIFVHSWVPVINKDGLPSHYTRNRLLEFNPDWRKASFKEWEDARWGNPFSIAKQGLLPDKTVVFGHWHCSTGWAEAEGISEFGHDAKFDPYYGDGFISIDACTVHSGKCNVIVIEDDFCNTVERLEGANNEN